MIIKSPDHSHFYRKDGMVYEVTINGIEKPLYQFPKRHPDQLKLTETGIDYLNRWLEFYPNGAKKIEAKKEEGQLKLF